MSPSDLQTMLLSILTSIITGGFILVFVEIGNRKNRENDRYDQIMGPFMHKLSAYFRFLSWCSHHIVYPKQLNGYEQEFKKLVDEIGRYGGRAITSGGDYSVGRFTADELEEICLKINNIWYYHDKVNPCNLQWKNYGMSDDFISKELKEFFPHYLSKARDVSLVSNVSGEFYTDIYQPIEYETYKHEAYIQHFKRQTNLVAFAVGLVLFVLTTMLFRELSVGFMQFSGVAVILLLIICLLMLGMDTKVQIKHYNRLIDFFVNMRKNKNHKKVVQGGSNVISNKMFRVILDSVIYIGLLLATWAILCVELGIIPQIPVPWEESIVFGLNRLFLNLAYSYITGVIVYWLVFKFSALKNK